MTKLDDLKDVGVIVSTIPPEGATVIPDALLANKPIMLDASYMPGGAPLTKRATAAGCDLIVGPHMLFEQATYQVRLAFSALPPIVAPFRSHLPPLPAHAAPESCLSVRFPP